MKILIQQAFIADPQSPHHGTIKDILIEAGLIKDVANDISEEPDQRIFQQGMSVSPGWIDIFSHFCDPGFEFKETVETGARAAAAGGYTDVFLIPNTQPVIDSKTQVEYIRQKSKSLPINIWPIGAVTKRAEGKILAEMYDMHDRGAAAFGDGINPIQSAGLLLKALQYVKAFEGVIIQLPDDKTVGTDGLMNEGLISTRLGLPGKPILAEELIIARDIKLASYADSKIHFTGVTSPKSLEYIKRAKDGGLQVSCSVTPYHLFFSDEDLLNYDSNLKVYPPLRSKSVTKRLRELLVDGTIDCVATHHLPHEHDSKVLEFEYAKFGMTGLETSYAILRTIVPELSETKIVELLSINPGKIFGLPRSWIEAGQSSCLTMFNPSATWIVTESGMQSKSKNSPFIGRELHGKVIGIVNGEKVFLNN